jgi:hypothetical protein
MSITARMSEAVEALLASLSDHQRAAATAPFDVGDHRRWTYLPGPRPGLSFADMSGEQRALALTMLDAGCSEAGARTARAVIELDMIRRRLSAAPDRQPDPTDHRYWVRILGAPGGGTPWGWRVNGHHLAVHVTVVGREVTVTPNFFGAEPARVPHGPHRGSRTLPDEEDLARKLLGTFDQAARRVAVVSDVAPADILTRFDPVANPDRAPSGLAHANMTGGQQNLLERLIRLYLGRAPTEPAATSWHDVLDAGIEYVTFAWAGPSELGHGHYYAVRGPTFLIEYDNTQDNANHIHSVWRDLRHDWGEDLLAAHYARHHDEASSAAS